MAGADGDGQRVALVCLTKSAACSTSVSSCSRHVTFGAVAVFLVALHRFQRAEHAEFAFDRDADGVRESRRLFCVVATLYERRRRSCRQTSSEPSIITEEKPERIAAMHTAGDASVVLVHDDRDVGIGFQMAAKIWWRRKASPAYLRAPAEACMITGASSSAAASMMAQHLFHVVDVEGRQAVAVFGGVVEQLAQRDEWHDFL